MYYMIISLYFLRVIYTYHFGLYWAFSFLSPLLINLLFFFNHVVTQEVPLPSFIYNRSCHIEDNVNLGWGESKGRKLLIMLSYFVKIVLFV